MKDDLMGHRTGTLPPDTSLNVLSIKPQCPVCPGPCLDRRHNMTWSAQTWSRVQDALEFAFIEPLTCVYNEDFLERSYITETQFPG